MGITQSPQEPAKADLRTLKEVVLQEEVSKFGPPTFEEKVLNIQHQVFLGLADNAYPKAEMEAEMEFCLSQEVVRLEEEIKERLMKKDIESLSVVYPLYRGQILPLSWREEDQSWLHSQLKKIEEAKEAHKKAKKASIVKKVNDAVLPCLEEETLMAFFSGKEEKKDDLLTFDKFGLNTLF